MSEIAGAARRQVFFYLIARINRDILRVLDSFGDKREALLRPLRAGLA